MRYRLATLLSFLVLSGCSTSSAPPSPTATSPAGTGSATVRPGATPRPTAALAAVDPTFAQAVRTLCSALSRRDAATITKALPYYQYNSGLRYGVLGDGEGQTGDPSLMVTWLAHSSVRCRLQSPGVHGHGAFLATGWSQPGGTALVELDTYSGKWKINDFTFGPYGALVRAMQTARPIVRYQG